MLAVRCTYLIDRVNLLNRWASHKESMGSGIDFLSALGSLWSLTFAPGLRNREWWVWRSLTRPAGTRASRSINWLEVVSQRHGGSHCPGYSIFYTRHIDGWLGSIGSAFTGLLWTSDIAAVDDRVESIHLQLNRARAPGPQKVSCDGPFYEASFCTTSFNNDFVTCFTHSFLLTMLYIWLT